MKRKVVWLVVTGGMVAGLLLTSCAPAAVKEEEKVAPAVKEEMVVPKEAAPEKEANLVKWTGRKLDGTVVEKTLEKPRYGGIHLTARPAQPVTFDDVLRSHAEDWPIEVVNEPLLMYDWTRGPAGTHDWAGLPAMMVYPGTYETGLLAERWELIRTETSDDLVFHIRQGVRWQDKPPLNGRGLTADDVVRFFLRNYAIGYLKTNYPFLTDMKNVENSIYVSPTDKWAVVVKNQPGMAGPFFRFAGFGRGPILAPELIWQDGKYQQADDWKKVVGTGPFSLKEYVPASSLTYVRNPDYWRKDPFFPQNQLPYLDGFKVLIIPDFSTIMAALRTGKIDNYSDTVAMTKEAAVPLMKTNPELKWVKYLDTGGGRISMRVDTKPFDDIRVRRALAMAVNNQEILDLYWGGDGVLFAYPIQPFVENMAGYLPLEQTSELVQQLYGYHPDKAKKLLAEAGYPTGFKTEVIAQAGDVDLLSIIKEYWTKIGVDLKIEVRDSVVYRTIGRRKTHTQMFFSEGGAGPSNAWAATDRKGGGTNYAMSDGVWYKVMYEYMNENVFDPAKSMAALKVPLAEGMPSWTVYANEQVWSIYLPTPNLYTFWQPWLKNYYGGEVTYGGGPTWTYYAWLDLELKKAMGR